MRWWTSVRLFARGAWGDGANVAFICEPAGERSAGAGYPVCATVRLRERDAFPGCRPQSISLQRTSRQTKTVPQMKRTWRNPTIAEHTKKTINAQSTRAICIALREF